VSNFAQPVVAKQHSLSDGCDGLRRCCEELTFVLIVA
jgi:hypothetical protein